jgi:hypothetical protein
VDSICNLGAVFFDGIERGKGDRYDNNFCPLCYFHTESKVFETELVPGGARAEIRELQESFAP